MELAGQEAVVRYRDTEAAGGYRLRVAGEEGAAAAFAVNIDPAESDLRTLDADKLATLDGSGKTTVGAESDTPAAGRRRHGGVRREFWMLLICCAGVLALAEMALAHRMSLPR